MKSSMILRGTSFSPVTVTRSEGAAACAPSSSAHARMSAILLTGIASFLTDLPRDLLFLHAERTFRIDVIEPAQKTPGVDGPGRGGAGAARREPAGDAARFWDMSSDRNCFSPSMAM